MFHPRWGIIHVIAERMHGSVSVDAFPILLLFVPVETKNDPLMICVCSQPCMTEPVPVVLAAQQNAFACYDSSLSIVLKPSYMCSVVELLRFNWLCRCRPVSGIYTA